MDLFEAAQGYIHDQIKQEKTISPKILLQLLTMCREASDAHLSSEQQSQLDMMVATVVGDIITDSKT